MTDRRTALDRVLRTDLATFVHRGFLSVNPGQIYHLNWHIQTIAHQLDRVAKGEVKRLLITVPPRSLKSLTVSTAWVAWVLGHDPTKRFVCISYSEELARSHARTFRALIRESWYQRLFPTMRIDPRKDSEAEIATTLRGGRLTTSVMGTITGRGGDIMIIDDPSNANDATSAVELKRVLDWYRGVLLSRLDSKEHGAIVVIMQRLAENDLAGYLIETGEYTVVSIPAIALEEEIWPLGLGRHYVRRIGEALNPSFESVDTLKRLEAEMGSARFSAQYLQRPVPAGGNIFKAAWIKRFKVFPALTDRPRIVQSWDVASSIREDADYSVCTTWVLDPGDRYRLINVVRDRWEFPTLLHMVDSLAADFRPEVILIEDTANGTAVIQSLQEHNRHNVIPIKPRLDKEARAQMASADFNAGRVFLPEEAPWLADLEHELLGFPYGRYDDQVDSVTQFLLWAAEKRAEPKLTKFEVWVSNTPSKWDV